MRGNKLLKFLDRYIGIPIVFILGLFKKKRKFPEKIKTIGVLKTAAIGDTVLLSAILKDLNEKFKNSEILFFVGDSNYEIGKIITYDTAIKIIKLKISNPLKSIKIIRQYKFDIFLDFGAWPRLNAILSFFSDSKYKIGFKTKNQYRHYVYDSVIKHNDNVHELYNYKNIIKPLNINTNILPEIKLKKNVLVDKNLATIHMFAGGTKPYLKEWQKEYWAEVINYLIDKNFIIYLTGIEQNKNKIYEVINLCRNKEKIVPFINSNLEELINILKKSYIVISVNTGIMHIASALKSNLIVLHGPTSEKRWGPLNSNSISLQSPLKCSPCLNLGFEYKCNENKCMRAIKPQDVIKNIEIILDKYK